MTTLDQLPPQAVSKEEEQAEKLRRVLSVKTPAPAPSEPRAAQPKPAMR